MWFDTGEFHTAAQSMASLKEHSGVVLPSLILISSIHWYTHSAMAMAAPPISRPPNRETGCSAFGLFVDVGVSIASFYIPLPDKKRRIIGMRNPLRYPFHNKLFLKSVISEKYGQDFECFLVVVYK